MTEENVRSGRALFTGEGRLENGGAPCISCHNLDRSDVTAGGALAKDLTDVFARLGGTGVEALIRDSPFPVMSGAFESKPLLDGEVFDLVAFLQFVAENDAAAPGPRYGTRLFFSGLTGALLLVGMFAGLWFRGKRDTVNRAIYDRQVKSR